MRIRDRKMLARNAKVARMAMAGVGQAPLNILPAPAAIPNMASRVARLSAKPASGFSYRYALVGGNWNSEVFPGRVVFRPEESATYVVSARPSFNGGIKLLLIDGKSGDAGPGRYFEVPVAQVMGGTNGDKAYSPMMVVGRDATQAVKSLAPATALFFEDSPSTADFERSDMYYATSAIRLVDTILSDFNIAMGLVGEYNPLTSGQLAAHSRDMLVAIVSLMEASSSVGAAVDTSSSGPRRMRLLMTVIQAKLKKVNTIYESLTLAVNENNISMAERAYATSKEYDKLVPLWTEMIAMATIMESGSVILAEKQARNLAFIKKADIEKALTRFTSVEQLASVAGAKPSDVDTVLAMLSKLSVYMGDNAYKLQSDELSDMSDYDLTVSAWMVDQGVKEFERKIRRIAGDIRQPVPGRAQGLGQVDILAAPPVGKAPVRRVLEDALKRVRDLFQVGVKIPRTELEAKAQKMAKVFTSLRNEIFRETKKLADTATGHGPAQDVFELRALKREAELDIERTKERIDTMEAQRKETPEVRDDPAWKEGRQKAQAELDARVESLKTVTDALEAPQNRLAAIGQEAGRITGATFEMLERDPKAYVKIIESLDRGIQSEDFAPTEFTKTVEGRESLRSQRLAKTFEEFLSEVPIPAEEAGAVLRGLVAGATRSRNQSEATAKADRILGILREGNAEKFDRARELVELAETRLERSEKSGDVTAVATNKRHLGRVRAEHNGLRRIVEGIDAALQDKASQAAKEAGEKVSAMARQAELSQSGLQAFIEGARKANIDARVIYEDRAQWVKDARASIDKLVQNVKKEDIPVSIKEARDKLNRYEKTLLKGIDNDFVRVDAAIGKENTPISAQQIQDAQSNVTKSAAAAAGDFLAGKGPIREEMKQIESDVQRMMSRNRYWRAAGKVARLLFVHAPFWNISLAKHVDAKAAKAIVHTLGVLWGISVYTSILLPVVHWLAPTSAPGSIAVLLFWAKDTVNEFFGGADSGGGPGNRAKATLEIVGVALLASVVMAGPRMFPLISRWVEGVFKKKRAVGRPTGKRKVAKVPGRGPGRPRKSQAAAN